MEELTSIVENELLMKRNTTRLEPWSDKDKDWWYSLSQNCFCNQTRNLFVEKMKRNCIIKGIIELKEWNNVHDCESNDSWKETKMKRPKRWNKFINSTKTTTLTLLWQPFEIAEWQRDSCNRIAIFNSSQVHSYK